MKNKKTIKQNSYIKHYTNKLLLILAIFFLFFGVANAGTLSDSSGVLTYDSVNICMADGSVYQSKFNNEYYLEQSSCTVGSDCTSIIQSLYDSLSAGDTLILDGNFSISNTLVFDTSATKIKCNTLSSSKYTEYNICGFVAMSNFTSGNDMIYIDGDRITLENLFVKGNSNTNNGIGIYGTSFGTMIKYTHVKEQGQNGLFYNKSLNAGHELNYVTSSENGLNGVEVRRNDVRINNFYAFRNWNGAGIMLNDAGGIDISKSHTFMNKNSLYLNGTDASSFTGNVFEQANGSAIVISSEHSAVDRLTFSSNIFYGNNYNTSGYPIFDIQEVGGNDIAYITIVGNNFKGDAHLFNFSGTDIFSINYDLSNTMRDFDIGEIHTGLRYSRLETDGSVHDYAETHYMRDDDGTYISKFDDGYITFYNSRLYMDNGYAIYMDDSAGTAHQTMLTSGNDLYIKAPATSGSATTTSITAYTNTGASRTAKISAWDSSFRMGTSTAPLVLTMYSPDGTAYECSVANGGAFSCT